ncbi:MAG: Gfo/Idh/MocA family oxidoreductase, partial [Rhodoferax sp.]|nr:Gfo/Idh/MocA family oxidoreductase [Rhodoferax sp.]
MLKLAVIGAGTIGRTHIERALSDSAIHLVGVCDPDPSARAWLQERQVEWFEDHMAMLRRTQAQAVVVATPNDAHAEVVLDMLAQGAAVLVEKPIADTVDNARRIHRAATDSGLPVLVGHQRRYNPIMRQARDIVTSGLLGRPVCVTALSTWYKDDDYFKAEWRTRPGGGPVLINLIHDLDLLRFLYGDIESLHALSSSAVRGHPVEDTA